MVKKNTVEYGKKSEIPKTPLRFVYFVAKQNARLGILAIVCVTIAQLCGVYLPVILKYIVDRALLGSGVSNDIGMWIFLFPFTMLLMFLFYRVSGFVGMVWLTRTEMFAYRTLFDYLTNHSHSYFSNRFAGSITNKIHHASEGSFRLLHDSLWGQYDAVFRIVASGVLFFLTSMWVGIAFVVLVLFLVPLNIYIVRLRRPFVVDYSIQKTRLRGSAVDVITNIGAVRQFARREDEYKMIDGVTEKVRTSDVRQWRMSEWALTLNNVLIVSALGLMLFVMYEGWVVGTVTSGDFVLVLTLLLSLSGTLVFIGSSMNQFIRVYGEVEEGLAEVLLPYEIVDGDTAQKLTVKNGEVLWNNVTFRYGDNTVFDAFNLTIKEGERIGLVGQSGAGKTTFVSLMLREHDLTGGAISIDGQNIAEVTQDSLREHIAVVPQEPMLFHRSIKDNIAYGKPDATMEEIIAVAKKAEAHDFITVLSEGYDTLVGERGVKLSGGQKQRIAIARAMLKNAPILILDEATSALDSESEVAIQKALHELMEGKTVIAIAHRLSTLREMDRIIVLEKGKIVEDGTHATLTKKRGGIYARLWKHQAGGFLVEDDGTLIV